MTVPHQVRTVEPSALDDAGVSRLESELRRALRGEVRFDDRARTLYATDASPYEIAPYGVVVPLDREDLIATVRICGEHRVPLLPRGGGTSLAGQTVGRAVVVDASKYLTKILDLDVEARTVTVEPGIVRDVLNAQLAPHGLYFTPDVSTTNRASLGGMVANNSAGTRSIKYGKSVDQVVAMTAVLTDGSVVRFAEVDDAARAAKESQQDREGAIYRTVGRVVREHADEIAARFPKVMRRVGGYNLDEFIEGRPFNLAKLVAGSEGTLAMILDVTVRLEPVPMRRMLVMLHFDSLRTALEAVPFINRHGPSAVELMDRGLFELGRRNPHLAPLTTWLEGMPEAVLMVEFDGATEGDVRRGLEAMRGDPEVARRQYHLHEAWSGAEQAAILQFRKDGLGIYATVEGPAKPTPFIEDAAIPPEHLAEYIPAVQALCRESGVDTVFYGHASVGVIHTRPLLDLKTAEGVALYREISERTFELVRRYGGSWSGEHGDGLIRSQQNRALFGDVLYEAFREVKRAFDPDGIMNPGKITDAAPMTENLRYGPEYPAVELDTVFDFSGQGGMLGAAEACTGVGACRKVDVGTMCPSYMATRDEDHSTRGRANVLRDALNGRMPGGLTSQEVYDTLDLCLECKACKAECPSNVDMAKLKYEFLQQHHDAHGIPLATLAIGNVARVAPMGRALAPLANALLPTPPVRWLVEKVAGVDRRRVLPLYADESFASWFRRRRPAVSPRKRAEDAAVDGGTERRVALFADTWTMYNETGPGQAAVRVLEALGYAVELVPYGCCGRPQISKGLLRDARAAARRNVRTILPYVERGIPVVGLEPSCITAFQDDYRDLLPGEDTRRVADHVVMIDQFLAKRWTKGEIRPNEVFRKSPAPLMLHGHCQQKAIIGTAASRALLDWVADDVREVDAGCCGMAGSFGYAHHDVSLAIGERRLFPAVREHAEQDGETVASGFSCRHQIADGTGERARHVIEILADALADDAPTHRREGRTGAEGQATTRRGSA